MIGMWKVMPALAAGCSIVIKPSETTPLTMLRVAGTGQPGRFPTAFLMSSPGQVLYAARPRHILMLRNQFYRFNRDGKRYCQNCC
ncbi:aldehyde dehydrogenase family protein [Escherichia coli]